MAIEPWVEVDEKLVADMKIFTVQQITARSPRTGQNRQVALVHTPNWVNMVAITVDEEVVLVRQYRHGIRSVTLEIPGGLVDPGESPEEAARRELREETGYTAATARRIGVVRPNPAFLDNECATFLLEGCRRTHELELDPGEDIEVCVVPLREIPGRIARGEIDHSLVICAFWWLAEDDPGRFGPGPSSKKNGESSPDPMA